MALFLGDDCLTNLIRCTDIWTKMIDGGSAVDIIYRDFSKAIDNGPL